MSDIQIVLICSFINFISTLWKFLICILQKAIIRYGILKLTNENCLGKTGMERETGGFPALKIGPDLTRSPSASKGPNKVSFKKGEEG